MNMSLHYTMIHESVWLGWRHKNIRESSEFLNLVKHYRSDTRAGGTDTTQRSQDRISYWRSEDSDGGRNSVGMALW